MKVDGINDVTGTFTNEELGVEKSKQELINLIANAPKASIIHVHNYEAKNNCGEVAHYFYLKGIDYGNMKAKSLALLSEMEQDVTFSVKVTRGVWKNSNGKISPTNRKNKKQGFVNFDTITETYRYGSSIMIDALAKARQSIEKPQYQGAIYKEEGNGIYSAENGTLHIRDCRLIHKTVTREGDYPQKATGEIVAVTNAIKRLLPIGQYRQVKLDGRFDYITVGGQIIMQAENGEKVYVGFAEHKGNVEPRIVGLEPIKVTESETVRVDEPQREDAESLEDVLSLLG